MSVSVPLKHISIFFSSNNSKTNYGPIPDLDYEACLEIKDHTQEFQNDKAKNYDCYKSNNEELIGHVGAIPILPEYPIF